MRLSPILDHMEQLGLGQIGQNLFQEFMPAQVSRGLLLTAQTKVSIDKYTGLRKGFFQVTARASSEDQAYDLAKQASDALCSRGLTLGDMRFYHILPDHDPLVYPRPDSELIEASVNFEIVFANI